MELTAQIVNTPAPTAAPATGTPETIPPQAVVEPAAAPAAADAQKYSEMNRMAKEKARLHRERMIFRQKQQELSLKEAQFKTWEETKAQAKLNPEKYLEQAGLSYEDLVQFKINGGKVTPEMEIKALRDDMAKAQRTQEESRTQQEQQTLQREQADVQETIENFKSDIHDFIHTNPDDYELTALYSVEHLVYETIETHWQQNLAAYNEAVEEGRVASKPKIMSKKEAADLVEQYMDSLVEQATKTKRYQKKYAPQPASEPGSESQRPVGDAGFQIKGMNNSMAGSASPSSASSRSKVEDDAFKRALSKL